MFARLQGSVITSYSIHYTKLYDFNFRATEFLVENGLPKYFDWQDDLSWYPEGRNVSATSQVMLHITAATTYQIFGVITSYSIHYTKLYEKIKASHPYEVPEIAELSIKSINQSYLNWLFDSTN